MAHFLDRFLGDPSKKFIKKTQSLIEEIGALEDQLEKLSQDELIEKTSQLQKVLLKSCPWLPIGDSEKKIKLNLENQRVDKEEITKRRAKEEGVLLNILPQAFALVREAAKKTVKQRHFDVQLLGGIILHHGNIAEMKTGEGKTLAATLPAFLNALLGYGVHIVTVNDYLAKRDAAWMGQIYDYLGLSVSAIVHDQSFLFDGKIADRLQTVSRKEAYLADITYGTNSEFGFDYLRDNMAPAEEFISQRVLNFGIVDEVDSILIDEARTPLIISAPAEESASLYQKFSRLVPRLEPEKDYLVDEKMRTVSLTDRGMRKMEEFLEVANVYSAENQLLAYHLEEALKAQILFHKDKDYVVKEGEVIIVDEFTGRLMPGRRYSEGLHQAIEAKEGVEVQRESDTLATISIQNLFRLYRKLAGMTGTAVTEAEEFQKIYGMDVILVPTNREMIRRDLQDRIYKTEAGKFQAITQEILTKHQKGQPILIGAISIEKNEILAKLLKENGIPHEVLNAKNHEREAHIIANAGRLGAVTLATNMAGRGTDIVLGGSEAERSVEDWQGEHNKVVELGGLHVIGSERHESRRIDNQLRGRAGRQGDPGSSQFFISMEDDLMRIFGGERMKKMMDTLGLPDDQAIENKIISRSIESAQKKVEGFNFDTRKHVLEFDDVMEKHRNGIYAKRRKVLFNSKKLREELFDILKSQGRRLVGQYLAGDPKEWNVDQLIQDLNSLVPLKENEVEVLKNSLSHEVSDTSAEQTVIKFLTTAYQIKIEEIGEDLMEQVEKAVYLRTIDRLWVDHLSAMNVLRTGIGLRAYAQTDPLSAYKQEGFFAFQRLTAMIEDQVIKTIFRMAKKDSDVGQAEIVRQSLLARMGMVQAGAEENLAGGAIKIQKTEFRGQMTDHQTVRSQKPPPKAGQPMTEEARRQKLGRNDPCYCGSDKKYKKCHGR